MKPIVDARDPALWQGVAPAEIWSGWKAGLERRIAEVFREDRPRPVVEVRADPEPHRDSGRR